jgi:hypothetical protein
MLTTEQKQQLRALSQNCPNLALSFNTYGFTIAYKNVHFVFHDNDVEANAKTLQIFTYVLQGMYSVTEPEIKAELKAMIELIKFLNAYKNHI